MLMFSIFNLNKRIWSLNLGKHIIQHIIVAGQYCFDKQGYCGAADEHTEPDILDWMFSSLTNGIKLNQIYRKDKSFFVGLHYLCPFQVLLRLFSAYKLCP